MRYVMVFLVLLALLIQVAPLGAAGLSVPLLQEDDEEEPLVWEERRASAFVVIYPQMYGDVGDTLVSRYDGVFGEEYKRLARLFETELALPISIRVYPTPEDYEALNALTPPLGPTGVRHTHLGSREIALVGSEVISDTVLWRREGLNILRYELASLFVEKVTDGKAPPGLLTGVGRYAEDPHQKEWDSYSGHAVSWESVWEKPEILIQEASLFQAESIVAYLIDVYGWEKFLELLHALARLESYRKALYEVYGVDLHDLEEHWELYHPLYMEGRWRANVIYGFDLSVFEEMIAAGAYADASEALKPAIEFLEKLGDEVKLQRAKNLLEQAYEGQEAGALVRQSRQALQNREYERCLSLALQARAKYEQLSDTRRLEELERYEKRAQEALDLWTELDEIQATLTSTGNSPPVERLIQLAQRFGELGERKGVEEIERILEDLEERRHESMESRNGRIMGLCVILLVIRIRMASWKRRPESELT